MTGLVATLLLALIALLGLGVWVGLALIATGVIGLSLFAETDTLAFLAGDLWRSLTAPELAALPLFVLMGEILNRSRLAEQLFAGLTPWLRPLPGGLIHSNVAGCVLFAAVSGSSAATAATVGRITLPELLKRGYDRRLVIGSLCGAGTLGFLIPPSIVLIIYGVLAQVSIVKLFIAGILPGLMLAVGYMLWIAVAGRRGPATPDAGDGAGRLRGLLMLLPVGGLIALVLGSMYLGLAGPTEAAVIGVAGALGLAGLQGALSLARLREALMAALATSSMLGLILAGAFFLSKVAALFQIPALAAGAIAGLGLPPLAVIALLLALYILLGMVLDGLSIIVVSLPVALPLVEAAGFHPLWFGIFLVIAVEMAQITPPVGFNLFVVQDLTGERIGAIARAALPFFLITAALAAILALFPGLVLWVV
mgnify:CR=1 FL=1